MPDYPYTVRNTVPLPHQRAKGPHICGISRTLEESIAFVRERVTEDGRAWSDFDITHREGARWWWEPNGAHFIMRVDNKPGL